MLVYSWLPYVGNNVCQENLQCELQAAQVSQMDGNYTGPSEKNAGSQFRNVTGKLQKYISSINIELLK